MTDQPMLIGDLARRTGVSRRALRHYEDEGLLAPRRTTGGYRAYTEEHVRVVARIRVMLAAGLNADLVRRYLPCLEDGPAGAVLDLCPDLRTALAALEERLRREQDELASRRSRLADLVQGS